MLVRHLSWNAPMICKCFGYRDGGRVVLVKVRWIVLGVVLIMG